MPDERDLIDEIRSVRRRLWLEHGGTVDSFAAWLREREAQHPERVVAPPLLPRTLSPEEIEELARFEHE